MGLTMEDLYHLIAHPVDSAVGTAREIASSFPSPGKYKKPGEGEAVPVPVAVPASVQPVQVALPTTLPTGSSEEAYLNHLNARGNRVRALMQ